MSVLDYHNQVKATNKRNLKIFAGILWSLMIPCIYLVSWSGYHQDTWYSSANAIVGILLGCAGFFGGTACMIESSDL